MRPMSVDCVGQPVAARGQLDMGPTASLRGLVPGQSGTVCAVPPIDLLPSLGVRCGKRLLVVARNVAGGPIVVLVDRRTIAIDRAIAAQIALCLDE